MVLPVEDGLGRSPGLGPPLARGHCDKGTVTGAAGSRLVVQGSLLVIS